MSAESSKVEFTLELLLDGEQELIRHRSGLTLLVEDDLVHLCSKCCCAPCSKTSVMDSDGTNWILTCDQCGQDAFGRGIRSNYRSTEEIDLLPWFSLYQVDHLEAVLWGEVLRGLAQQASHRIAVRQAIWEGNTQPGAQQ